ncbi:DDE superfamily endonuclease [Phytophthora infestans]|uniref:DDE superfamily endonuclease n=1 Tax=Phytophthora infestans TaxID=4787 RepID=A0A833SS78_PHYIN|nr:DDE superfamily endonuclease [Phytophthora infestans]
MLLVVHPQKKPCNGELTSNELAHNARVSSGRVLVENFFGRVCLLCRIMHSTFKWSESSFDSFARTCFALPNFHTDINPLRVDDGRFYRSVTGQYASMAKHKRSGLASIQRRYRRRRTHAWLLT